MTIFMAMKKKMMNWWCTNKLNFRQSSIRGIANAEWESHGMPEYVQCAPNSSIWCLTVTRISSRKCIPNIGIGCNDIQCLHVCVSKTRVCDYVCVCAWVACVCVRRVHDLICMHIIIIIIRRISGVLSNSDMIGTWMLQIIRIHMVDWRAEESCICWMTTATWAIRQIIYIRKFAIIICGIWGVLITYKFSTCRISLSHSLSLSPPVDVRSRRNSPHSPFLYYIFFFDDIPHRELFSGNKNCELSPLAA